MTRKDYVLIADTILKIAGASRYYIADLFADALEKAYGTFERDKFLTFINTKLDKELEAEATKKSE